MSILESATLESGGNPIAAASSKFGSVLVIDDEAAMRKALSAMLQAAGYVVVTAGSGKAAVEQSRRQHFDLAITDLLMPEMDGIQTMAALKVVDPEMEVMVMTGHGGVDSAEGDEVVFFSPLRHIPAGSPNLRFPFSTAPLAARAALEGHETFLGFNDYRGVPVVAATQYIQSTGWGMVDKIDRAEAYENVRRMALVEELAVGLLIILLGGLLAFHRRTVLMRALKQKEGEFRALLDSAPDAMAITDREGRIVLVNTQAEILFGFERKELIGRALGMLFPEWARGRSGGSGPEDFSEVVARHMGKTFEMCGFRKGGKESPFEVRLGPVKEIEGDLFACGIRDITERKHVEQALANERDLLHALMDNLPDYIYFKDPQSRFLRTNMAHAKTLGLSDPAQAIGKTDFDFFPREYAKNYYEDERKVFQTGQPLTGRVESVRQPEGEIRWCSTT